MNMTISDSSATSHELQTLAQNFSFPEGCSEVRFSQMEFLPWDNPDNIASAAVEKFFKRMKYFMTGFLFLIGGPANVINMAVFYKQGLQDRVNLCLFSLSFTDCLFLTASVVLHGENIYYMFSGKQVIPPSYEFLTNNNFVILMGLCFVSLVISAIIACERCYCVFRPLNYQSLLSTKTMGLILIAVYLFVFGLYFLVTFRYSVGCIHDPETGVVLKTMVAGIFYLRHKDVIDFLDSIVFGAGFPGGAITVVLVATVLTAIKLRQIVTWRTETSTALSPREVALTKMLIGSSVFFIICISPSCVFRVAALFIPEMTVGKRYHNFYYSTLWISSVLTNINATFNLFVYYAMGSRYRQTFWTLFNRNVKGEKYATEQKNTKENTKTESA